MLEILEGKGLSFLFPLMKLEKELLKQIKADPAPQTIYKWIKDNISPKLHTDKGFVNILMTRYDDDGPAGRNISCKWIQVCNMDTWLTLPKFFKLFAVHFPWDAFHWRWRPIICSYERAARPGKAAATCLQTGDAKIPAWSRGSASQCTLRATDALQRPCFPQRYGCKSSCCKLW